MRFVACALAAALMVGGCGPSHKPSDPPPVSVELDADEQALMRDYRGLNPLRKKQAKSDVRKRATQSERESRWAARLWIAGIGLSVLAGLGVLLKLLGVL